MTSGLAEQTLSTTGAAEYPSPPTPSSSTGTKQSIDELRALVAIQHRQMQAALKSDEPNGVGEILQSLMSRSPIRLPQGMSSDKRTMAYWRAANIPKRHAQAALDDETAPKRWRRVRDGILDDLGSGFSYALLGPRGTGKTQIAVQAVLAAVRTQRYTVYCKAMDVFLWIRRAKSLDEPELDAISEFLSPQLLVIDEVGERGETEFEDRMLVHIIDKRYDAMKDTIIIANLMPDEFREAMGPSISDRLRETGGAIVCDWESFRRPKQEQPA